MAGLSAAIGKPSEEEKRARGGGKKEIKGLYGIQTDRQMDYYY